MVQPTRLECMMQDYPKLLTGSNASRVSFTQYEKWTSFSAVKNAISDAVAKQKAGNAPESGSSGEADVYYWFYNVLKQAGVQFTPLQQHTYAGVEINEPPHIVLTPKFGVSHQLIKDKFVSASDVHITSDSTLIIDGANVTVKSLKLSGALTIEAVDDAIVTVEDLSVHNDGWHFNELSSEQIDTVEQKYAVRGYTLSKSPAEQYVFAQPGTYVLSDRNKTKYTKK